MNTPSAPSEAPLFSPGDTVMHAAEGICTIKEIRQMNFGAMPAQSYYILKPEAVKSSSTVYMPVSRGNKLLRRLLSEQDIHGLIAESRSCEPVWIEDNKLRKDAFYQILRQGDYPRIIRMISEIYAHNEARQQTGRKPCAGDETIREEAERLLHQEFSCVLHLSQAETANYIRRQLSES